MVVMTLSFRICIDLQLKLTHVLHSKLTHPCNEDYVS